MSGPNGRETSPLPEAKNEGEEAGGPQPVTKLRACACKPTCCLARDRDVPIYRATPAGEKHDRRRAGEPNGS